MILTSTLAKWVARHRRRSALRELCELDDRLLRDIGLRRDDVLAAMRQR